MNTGCPEAGCTGFELTQDLEFDTHTDGKMDGQDEYWNEGKGWLPLGHFTGTFDGNGHHIRNLFINQTNFSVGLFTSLGNATIRRLIIDGPLMSVATTGNREAAGAIAGNASNSNFSEIVIQGRIQAELYLGGLAGRAGLNRVNAVVIAAQFSTDTFYYFGLDNDKFTNVLLTGQLIGNDGIDYLKSRLAGQQSIVYVYGQSYSAGVLSSVESLTSLVNGGINTPRTPEQLRCGGNIQCNGGTDFSSWQTQLGSDGKPYWDLGNGQQAPGLRLFGRVYRDSDGDGVFDDDDGFPRFSFASLDTDKDGAPDHLDDRCDAACFQKSGLVLDQFPNNAAAFLDADQDGKPDAWTPNCDARCQAASGLALDAHPNDSDNDGISNERDTDDFNSGQADADSNSNGLIEIHAIDELSAMRFSPEGDGFRWLEGNVANSSGCPNIYYQGRLQARCHGFELANNLDFDTNQDGRLDQYDAHWSPGWKPIPLFKAEFNGNGFQIRNFYVHETNTLGLFDTLENALVQNLVIAGPHTRAQSGTGGLITFQASDSRFYRLVLSGGLGSLTGGSVAGEARRCEFNQILSATELLGDSFNGLFGNGYDNKVISSVVTGVQHPNGRNENYGVTTGSTSIERSLIARLNSVSSRFRINPDDVQTNLGNEASYFLDSHEVHANGKNRFSLDVFKCATRADSTECTEQPIYQGWGKDLNDRGTHLWNFGTAQQMPGFNLFGQVFRDGDGDGVLDQDDQYPALFAASRDADGDAAPDIWTLGCDAQCRTESKLVLDQFPNNPAIGDADVDGLPDSWAATCDASCRSHSGYREDKYPNDSDNDGKPNSTDTDDNSDGRVDVDADSNGLVDIYTLEQLDAVRNNPTGSGRTLLGALNDNSGCPAQVSDGLLARNCWGYELKADLDFDTNRDGKMDAKDTYWYQGSGWDPLPLATRFEGNGHVIRNLWINRSFEAGLFGVVTNSRIEHLELSGPLTRVVGDRAGLLVGRAEQSQINDVTVEGRVEGSPITNGLYGIIGGLVGTATNTRINGAFVQVQVRGNTAAGVVGDGTEVTLSNCLAAGFALGESSAVGLIGGSTSAPTNSVSNCLSLASLQLVRDGKPSALGDTVQAVNTYSSNLITLPNSETPTGLSLAQLICPTAANNTQCAGQTLYQDWDKALNTSGKAYWLFGDGKQLPGLVLFGKTFRDADGDGTLDTLDAFPLDAAAAQDSDKDGAPDAWNPGCNDPCRASSSLLLDQFPLNAAAALDDDRDGLPDSWNAGCDSACKANAKLTLDTHLGDLDNDGIADSKDDDENGDGQPDADLDGNGLVEISSLAQLNAIRFDLAGKGRTLNEGKTDSSGCPKFVVQGLRVQQCHGYELKQNLDFDTNQDGKIDAQDSYWNEGKGWSAPAGSGAVFTGTFNGNGFAIHNLWSKQGGALLGNLYRAQVTHLVLDGPLMILSTDVREPDELGAVANSAEASTLSELVVTGTVEGESYYTGSIIGRGKNTQMNAVVGTSKVKGTFMVGGLAGYMDETSGIRNALSSGTLKALSPITTYRETGGLSTGEGYLLTSLSSRRLDAINPGSTSGTSPSTQTLGATYFVSNWVANSEQEPGAASLAQLQCPTSSDNTQCAGKSLYEGWSKERDSTGQPYWDFGSNTQLPGLRLFGNIYRDGDGDGVLEITRAPEPNQAPSLELTLTQAGKTVVAAVAGEGDIQITAQAKDPNSGDTLSYSWYLDGKKLTTETTPRLSLNSQTLTTGTHQVKALVTDSGTPSQSANQTISFELKPAAVVGGALDWRYLLALMLCSLSLKPQRNRQG
ncbi:MAG: hypothetical protein RL497_294 [Pseudomonadota bacterium]